MAVNDFDLEMAIVATELITEFGKDVTYYQNNNTINPITGELTTSETTFSIRVAPPSAVNISNVDNKVIQAGDMEVILDGDITFYPEAQDILLLDGIRYNIVAVSPLYSGDLIAIYTIFCRTTEGV